MSLAAPGFWYRPQPTLASTLLSPAAAVYAAVGALRQSMNTARRAPVPVICVGNLVAGGAGKTPTCLALAKLVEEEGGKPAFLTRGHGGNQRGPTRVDPAKHTAGDVGDEPLLLAATAPTWVSRDRLAGATKAAEDGTTIVIMDDGFQNPTIAKDFSLIVIDGPAGFGNGRVHPAGPLREPISRGLSRAQAILIIGPDDHGVRDTLPPGLPVFTANIAPGPDAKISRHQRIVAFAGIGRPQKFFNTVEEIGCTLVASHVFPDHHTYTPDEIMRLCDQAAAAKAIPLTTQKDAARLPPEARAMVQVLPVDLVWDDAKAIRQQLAALSQPMEKRPC